MGRWLDQWSNLENNHEATLWQWLSPLEPKDFKGKSVLDAGCGNGGNTLIISKYCSRITGVDLESTASPLIKKGTNINYFKGNLENLDFKNTFDVGYSVGVLHHLDHPDEGFKNLVEAVKPGGDIAVWVYSKEGNALMRWVVEPLKSMILLRLPSPLFKAIAHLATWIGYFLAYNPLYLVKSFSFLPYYRYFQFWRQYQYQRNYMNVYDKLNAPTTHWISKERITMWSKKLSHPKISDFNGVSWRLSGKRPLQN